MSWRPAPGREPKAALFTESHRGDHYALLMLMPPAAFFLIGVFIWLLRSWKPEQVEEDFHVGALLELGNEGHVR